ncbi:MAG: ATP-dependent helicase [Atribacterota bacterium]
MNKLNKEQEQVMKHFKGPALVTAVPGAGKTFSLVERIAYLISNHNINPRNILCITFTNKAAKEMKERICKRLKVDELKSYVGTFHALCANILRVYGYELGYDMKMTILDDQDQEDMIKKIVRQLGKSVKEDDINISTIKYHLNKFRENVEDIISLEDRFEWGFYSEVAYEYLKQIKEQNCVDFSGLIYETIQLLKQNEEIRKDLENHFEYIQVDEVQDTNLAQFEFIKLIGKHENIMLVGDLSQSIYRFRNARYENIIDFINTYSNCTQLVLGQNYRSTPEIVKRADKLIRKNKTHMVDFFETKNPSGDPVFLEGHYDSKREAQAIANHINYYIYEMGWDFSDITILYRLNRLSLDLQTTFSNNNIPFTVIGGQNFFSRREIKDVIAMLRFASNKKDAVAFHRVAALFKGVGETSIGMIENESRKNNISILEACGDIDSFTNRISLRKAATRIKETFEANFNSRNAGDALAYLVKKIDYINHLKKTCKTDEESKERIANVLELINNATEFSQSDSSIEAYLQNILLASSSDKEANENAVTLMTIHASKGLEFPIVFLVGVEENILPHSMSLKDAKTEADKNEAIEEERRICYVAMTRAAKKLHISYCNNRYIRSKSGKLVYIRSKPSPFIKESGFTEDEKFIYT